MYNHLTPVKYRKAESILESYRQQLIDLRRMDCLGLECELCDCWNLEYPELRTAFIDLLDVDRYAYMAAYYMQHDHFRHKPSGWEFFTHIGEIGYLDNLRVWSLGIGTQNDWEETRSQIKSDRRAFLSSEHPTFSIEKPSGPK